MKTRLTHVRVNVSDIEKSLKWYETVLGFENNGGWPLEKPNYYGFVSEEGASFSIMAVHGGFTSGRYNFQVDDVDELWETLKDKAEVVEALFDTAYGTRKFTIKDLDGNELGFCK